MAKVKFDTKGHRVHYLAHIKISIIINSRHRPELFKSAMDSLVATCSNPGIIEVLLKVDTDDHTIPGYIDVLTNLPFEYKLLVADRRGGYWTLNYSHNDLAKLSWGQILWIYCDDIQITQGDWVSLLLSTRDVFQDNIYVVRVPGSSSQKGKAISPAFSREWLNVLSMVSPHVYADKFLQNMAKKVGRFLIDDRIMNGIKLQHSGHKIARPPIDKNHRYVKDNIDYHINKLAPSFQNAMKG